MGVVKKSPLKGDRTPAKRTRALSAKQDSPLSASKIRTPPTGGSNTPRTFTSKIPTKEELASNGRVQGRSLVKWNRPRMAEKLLLHLYYECIRHKVLVPWDTIAHRFHPGSSGGAIQQHLNRLRKELISEGHLVPPVPFKSGTFQDPDVRGYIRENMEGNDKETVRPVPWSEYVEDPKYNLPDAFVEDDDEVANDVNPQLSFVSQSPVSPSPYSNSGHGPSNLISQSPGSPSPYPKSEHGMPSDLISKSPGSPSPYPKSGHGMPSNSIRAMSVQPDDPFGPGLDGTQEIDVGTSFASQPVTASGRMYNTPPQQSQSFSGLAHPWGNIYSAPIDPSMVQSYHAQGGHSRVPSIDQADYGVYPQSPYATMQATMLQSVPRHASPEETMPVCTTPLGYGSSADAYIATPFTPPGQIATDDDYSSE